MTEALNHSRIWSLISKTTRNALPDLSAVAEREMEKLISSAMRNTLDRVASDTSSGRANVIWTPWKPTPLPLWQLLEYCSHLINELTLHENHEVVPEGLRT